MEQSCCLPTCLDGGNSACRVPPNQIFLPIVTPSTVKTLAAETIGIKVSQILTGLTKFLGETKGEIGFGVRLWVV